MAAGGRTLRFTLLGDLFLIVHAHVDPDPREWSFLMDESRGNVQRFRRCLVSSGDSKLNAKQRSDLGDFVKSNECTVAVLLDSAVTRGIVTALGWVTGNKYRAFGSDDIERAVTFLGSTLDPAKIREEIRRMLREMQQAPAAGVVEKRPNA